MGRSTPSLSKAPLSRACVLWSNQSAVLVFDLSHQSGLFFMAACQSFSICACQMGQAEGQRGDVDKRGNSCPRHDIVPTVDCLSPLPLACPAALPACLFHVQFSPWLIFDEKFSVSHYSCASATLVALPPPAPPSPHSSLPACHASLHWLCG